MAGKQPPADRRSQRQRFIDTAREIGADEDEAKFRDKLKRIARATVEKEPPLPKKKKTPAK